MRTLIAVIMMASLTGSLRAQYQDEHREIELPYLTLVQPPVTPELKAAPLSMELRAEIEACISKLKNASLKDLTINSDLSNWWFVPVGKFDQNTGWFNKQSESITDPVRRLVEIGPIALPFLLDGLDNDASTDVVIRPGIVNGGGEAGMTFDQILHGNPTNPTERFVLNLNRSPFSLSIRPIKETSLPKDLDSYRVKVGDVCLVIIGHIVGRKYKAIPLLSGGEGRVCSPVSQAAVRERVRKIWSSGNPRKKVLESLLLDFSTRGMLCDPFDYREYGTRFQVQAAIRMAFYYPESTAGLLVKRLESFAVTGDGYEDWISSGVRREKIIDAIGWTESKPINAALQSIAKKATHESLVDALRRTKVVLPNR